MRSVFILLLIAATSVVASAQSYDSYPYNGQQLRSPLNPYPQRLPGWSPTVVTYYRSNHYHYPYRYVPKVPARYRKNLWRRSNIPGTKPHGLTAEQAKIEEEWPNRFNFEPPPAANADCPQCPLVR